MDIKIKTYKCGLRLQTSFDENKKGASIYINFFVGSQNENANEKGISHLLEHMMFKDSNTRNASQISKDFEALGATVNAYTNSFQTVYYANALAEKMSDCAEIFSDAIFNSKFSETEFESEKKVIFEEILMRKDRRANVCYENFCSHIFKGTSLESSVAGTKESVKAISINQLKNYHKKHYIPQNMIITFSGGVSQKEADKIIKKHFLPYFNNTQSKPKLFCAEKNLIHKAKFEIVTKKTDTNQTYVIIGFPIYNIATPKQNEYEFLSLILGAGISSKFYLKVREQLGLVYNINAFDDSFEKCGNFLIQYSTNPENEEKTILAIKEVIQNVLREGITESDLEKAKTFLKTRVTFKHEATVNFGRALMYEFLTQNKNFSLEKTFEKINQMTIKKLNKVLKEIFMDNECVCSVVSTNPRPEIYEALRKI